MAPTTITIVLELDETEDLPVGRAYLPGGPPREFHGWLALTEAIDTLASRERIAGVPEVKPTSTSERSSS